MLGYLNTRPRTTYQVALANPNPRLREPVENPFHHGGDHGSEGDHNGETEQASAAGASFLDPSKQHTDDGYAVSLRVLGAMTGVNA